MVLVMAHATIIGYVRAEAAKLKTVASKEISLGMYYVPTSDRQWLTQLRMLLAVSPERRSAVKATIEHNRWLVHQAVEEALRQIDRSAFDEPKMTLVKERIKQVIDESLHEKVVERILICDRFDLPVEQFRNRQSPATTAPHSPHDSTEAHSDATKLTHAPAKDEHHAKNEHHADSSHSGHASAHSKDTHPVAAPQSHHAHTGPDAHAHSTAKELTHAPAKEHAEHASHAVPETAPADDAHSSTTPHSQPASPTAHTETESHSGATQMPHGSTKDEHPAASGHKEPNAGHAADAHTEVTESHSDTPQHGHTPTKSTSTKH